MLGSLARLVTNKKDKKKAFTIIHVKKNKKIKNKFKKNKKRKLDTDKSSKK